MTTFKLYDIWKRLLAQWLTDTCTTRRTNLTWLTPAYTAGAGCGAVLEWAGANQRHCAALADRGASQHLTRRLSRFLVNAAVRPGVWFRPVARQLLARAAQHRLILIIDASKVGAGHQLVMVALAYKHRALPLAWTWVPYAKGAVSTDRQLALFKRVHGLLPKASQVIFVGDAGFSSVLVLRQMEVWGWDYVLRQKGKFLLQRPQQTGWERLDSLVTAAGQQAWLVRRALYCQVATPHPGAGLLAAGVRAPLAVEHEPAHRA